MRHNIIKKTCITIVAIVLANGLYSQKNAKKEETDANRIVIPEEVKKKCPEKEMDERVRLAVARFSKSTTGANGANIDNFSSMLANAMYEVNCFRVISMAKDSMDFSDANGSSEVKPQLIITGEITEYNHSVKETNLVVSKKTTTTAHIGFILQIKDPSTRDVLFSKSFNEEGGSDNKSLQVTLPSKSALSGPASTIGRTTNDNVDKAYFDALEKGIIAAVTYIVDNRDKIYNIAKNSSSKAIITALNTSFPQLMKIEKALKELGMVKKIDKSLNNNVGKIEIYYSGKIDEVIDILSNKMNRELEITALKDNIITVKCK
jgi:curli biogenesis system outer membrane secretion channel CsgG